MAILLLFCYFSYLYFSMVTHSEVFDDQGDTPRARVSPSPNADVLN
eukprot:gene2990-16159_t